MGMQPLSFTSLEDEEKPLLFMAGVAVGWPDCHPTDEGIWVI